MDIIAATVLFGPVALIVLLIIGVVVWGFWTGNLTWT